MIKHSEYVVSTWELCWYATIMIIGVFGNVMVLIVGYKSKNISRIASFNIYISSLAVIDLLICLLVVPTYVLSTNYLPRLILYFFTFWFLHASMYMLVAICIERRRAVLYPFSTLRQQSLKKSLFIVFGVALLGFANELPYIYGLVYPKEKATKLTFHMIGSALEIMIPMSVFIVSFIQIHRCLLQRESDLNQFLDKYKHERKYRRENMSQQMQSKRSTIKTMQLVIITFFLCILPNEILYVLLQYSNITELKWGSPVYQVGILLRFSTSCLNPILYSCRSQKFRKNFKEVFQPPQNCSSEYVMEHIRNTNFNYTRLSSDSMSSDNPRTLVL